MYPLNVKKFDPNGNVKCDCVDRTGGYFTNSSVPTDFTQSISITTVPPFNGVPNMRMGMESEQFRVRIDHHHSMKTQPKTTLDNPIGKVSTYLTRRWNIFASYTTIHGVREIDKAPCKKLKVLWLCVLTACATVMLYQIYKLTAHYLTEPTTTTVTVKNDFYQLPLFLLIANIPEFFSIGNLKKGGIDKETLIYARSLVDDKVQLPDGHDFGNGKMKFDRFLQNNPNLTWHDILEPHVTNLSYWIGQGEEGFRVRRRSLWNTNVYHILEPAKSQLTPDSLNHDFVVEAELSWNSLNFTHHSSVSDNLIVTSYSLLSEGTPLEPGHIYKIRFEMTSKLSVNLRRKPCVLEATQYLMYDQQRCNETCLIRAKLQYAPRKCYHHSSNWGFYEFYSKLRPCSKGFYNSTGGPFWVEYPDRLKGGDTKKMKRAYEECFIENCRPACEQLSVKVSTDIREFTEDLINRSLLYVTWPAPTVVPVYVEALQYTWDSFVGQIGGLIGLWMGASMISAFEAFYLCCCCCYDLASDDDTEYEDEERMYGGGNERAWYGHHEMQRRDWNRDPTKNGTDSLSSHQKKRSRIGTFFRGKTSN